MKAILVCRTASLLEQLAPLMVEEGFQVTREIVRKSGQPLTALLAGTGADLAVVDSPADRADLAALETVISDNPQLAVLMLTPERDADVLIAAMRAGVREVLTSPPGAAELQASLRRVAQRRPGVRNPSRVVAFISCKGGSGATFLATNVGYLLATEEDKTTALVDLDLQYGDASYFVTDTPAQSSLADLTRQVDRLDAKLLSATMVRIAPKFTLLAAPDEPEAALSITAPQLERVLDVVAQNHEVLVLDVERMIDAVAVKALDRADVVFLVLENMLPHVRDAKRLVRILRTLGYPDSKMRLVVNRYEPHGGISVAQIEEAVGIKVAHTVPDSRIDVVEALNTGVPLVKVHRDGAVARALRAIARDVAGKSSEKSHGWIGRLIG